MSERTPSDAGSPKVPTIPPPPSRSAPPPPPPPKPRAPGTILGVAPPKLASEPAIERNPVFVRSESIADEDLSPALPAPAPLPGGFPQVPVPDLSPLSAAEPPTDPNPLMDDAPRPGSLRAALSVPVRIAGADLPLWSLLGPVLLLVVVLVAVVAVLIGSATEEGKTAALGPSASAKASASAPPAPKAPPKPALAKLIEGRAPETLTVTELLQLDDARAEKERDAAQELRERLGKEPEAVKDKAVLRDLQKYANNPETAREALAAMAAIGGSLGPDMLYEIWTGTQARTDTTELARALLHTRDVRSKASPALAIALELRQAGEDCEKNKAILPRALKDGDKRILHLLLKLQRKQGCGPKKKDDCFQCLRGNQDLDSAISAIKARKAPAPFTP